MSVFGPAPRSVLGSVFPARGFSPRSLFSAGEVGAWYDPSDLSTLYQDTAGTQPVTTPGQRVALMLDKSRGLVLGPELVTNGDFSGGDTTGWTATTGITLSVISGAMRITRGATTNQEAYQAITTEAGKTYEYSFSYVGESNNGTERLEVRIGTSAADFSILTGVFPSTGASTRKFVATSATTFLRFLIRDGSSGDWIEIDNISVRELPGNHATQATLAQRPHYQIDAGGRPYLEFDGIDDGLVTGTITPGADKAQVFAGVRKLSDVARGTIAELTASAAANNGAFHLTAPNAASDTFAFESKGTSLTDAVASSIAAPATRVLAGLGDIAGDTATLRVNGVQADQDTGDQGTGNYAAAVLYLGRRGGASLPLSGHLYGAIVRFSSANLGAAQIAATERWMNSKTGAF